SAARADRATPRATRASPRLARPAAWGLPSIRRSASPSAPSRSPARTGLDDDVVRALDAARALRHPTGLMTRSGRGREQSLLGALSERPVVFDGAMGTALYERGILYTQNFDHQC